MRITMKIDFKHISRAACLLVTFGTLTLSGCGDGESGSDATTSAPDGPATSGGILEGRVADGYLVDATVFLDLNGNKSLDAGEPSTLSGSGGHFKLDVEDGLEQLHPVVVRVHAGETSDEDDQLLIDHDYILETPVGLNGFISPLTTMVKQELDKNAIFDLLDAENMVRGRLGLDSGVGLWDDYIAAERDQSETTIWRKTHDLARVLAQLNGRLLTELKTNLGNDIASEDLASATSVVSDHLMEHAASIEPLIGQARPLSSNGLTGVVDQILARIDTTSLNREILDRYRTLLARKPQTWDAVPPRILAQQPATDLVVPVDTKVVLNFSEPIDPDSLKADSIIIQGGGQIFAGDIRYLPETRQVEFTPFFTLYALASYSVDVSPEITDLQGNPLGPIKIWNFSTLFTHSPPSLPAL